jgi:hypothetical protein
MHFLRELFSKIRPVAGERGITDMKRMLEIANSRNKLPELDQIVDVLVAVEKKTNYATLVDIALETAAEIRGIYVGELKSAHMKLWWQWHNHRDDPRDRAKKVIIITGEAAQVYPDSEIGWTLISLLLVWFNKDCPDRSANLRKNFGDTPSLDEIRTYQASAISPAGVISQNVMVYIKALAQSGNQRSDAIEALIKLGDAGVDALATALEDSDSDIRVDACDALGLMGSTRALEPLASALRKGDVTLRKKAVGAFWQLFSSRVVHRGDSGAVEPLIAALADEDARVRSLAADTLSNLGDQRAVGPLNALLKDADESVAKTAERALYNIQHLDRYTSDPSRALDLLFTWAFPEAALVTEEDIHSTSGSTVID